MGCQFTVLIEKDEAVIKMTPPNPQPKTHHPVPKTQHPIHKKWQSMRNFWWKVNIVYGD